MEVVLPDVSGHPAIVYLVLVLTAGWIVVTIFPQITGRFQKYVKDTAANRRAAATEADDADIAERDRKIAYLEGINAERLREMRARDALIAAHSIWDRDRYYAALNVGEPVDPPPPLFPILETPTPVDSTSEDQT